MKEEYIVSPVTHLPNTSLRMFAFRPYVLLCFSVIFLSLTSFCSSVKINTDKRANIKIYHRENAHLRKKNHNKEDIDFDTPEERF